MVILVVEDPKHRPHGDGTARPFGSLPQNRQGRFDAAITLWLDFYR